MGRRKTIDRVLALILCVILILLPNTFKVSALTGIEEVVISNIEAFKDSITVEWTPVDGVTAYEIEVDGVVINNGIDTVYKHMGLDQGTSHSYRVRAKIEDTTGAWSDLLLETTLDVTSPHISLIGDEAIALEVGTSYTDEGAIAIDNVDGDITESITTTGIVDTEILGEYKTVYLVSDSSDNEATVTRAIYVEDTTKPIITLTGNNNIELNIGDTYTEAGAIANDNYDGDISDNIIITGDVDTAMEETYTVKYNVSDSSGNVADEVIRTINVVSKEIIETTPPEIIINGGDEIALEVGSNYIEEGATATDSVDGDITNNVIIEGEVDTNILGDYEIIYKVSNSERHTATATKTIHIVDTTKPVINLNGSTIIELNIGDTYTEAGAIADDNYDGDISSDIITTGTVDTSEEGNYTVKYNVTDSSGNEADEVVRTINVKNNEVPEGWIEIHTPEDLAKIGKNYSYPLNGKYILMNNIDLSGYEDWTPIGGEFFGFSGEFDGNGYKIENLTIDSHYGSQGLFGITHKRAVIKNLGLENVNISSSRRVSIGGLVGSNYGDIENCYVEGNVKGESSTGLLAGFNDGTIEKSYANGSVEGDSQSTGGLVGYNFTGTIKETYSSGSVYGDKDNVGGLVGYNFAGNIKNSYSTASVEGRHNVGGLVGEMTSGSITNCYSTGEVSTSNKHDKDRFGRNIYGSNKTGGLVGNKHFMVTIKDSYWDTDTSGQTDSDGGIGKTTAEMKQEETFNNWDFENIWIIDRSGNINSGYPCIQDITSHIEDDTPLTISLNGDSEITLEVGTSYVEEGATAIDGTDGDITDNIAIEGEVDTNTLGNYEVIYGIGNSEGDTATVTRTIHVVDTTKPVINLNGSTIIELNIGDTYTEAGAIANDNYDGDISSNIITTGTVDTSEEGNYTVKYNVTDSSGNEADEVVRTINVKNNEVPEGWIEIHTPEDLAKIGKNYSYPLNGKYILMNNIDLSGYEDWTPIGGEFFGFSGEFDGNGYKIENLTIDSHYGSQGLFGITHKRAVIKNLGLENVNISSSRRVSIGGLVGSNYGDIENCYVEGTVEGESSTGLLAGFNDGTIEKSYANGSVEGDSQSTGGLVGYNFTGTIKETYSSGSVYGDKDNVGGLVGYNFAGNIKNSYSTASVEGRHNVGGLVGEMTSGSITNCYSTGEVSTSNKHDKDRFGRNIYGSNKTGGLVGNKHFMVTIKDSYWDTDTSGQTDSDGGIGKTTAEMKQEETFNNWDFENIWIIDRSGNINNGYPCIQDITSHIEDGISPIIMLNGDSEITLEVGTSYVEEGATATDDVDGDITDNIITQGEIDTEILGDYTISYQVSDSAGNTTTVIRTIHVVDTIKPVITLNGENNIELNIGDTYTEVGAIASDNYDGDISNNIIVTGTVDTSVEGTYTVEYNVSDSSGNVADEVIRTVVIIDRDRPDITAPEITLNGDSEITLEVGTSYVEEGAIATDDVDGDITDNITIEGEIDTEVLGDYTITYQVSDSAGNIATAIRTIHVVDTTKPVINLNGSTIIELNIGDTYTEAGAIADDNYDGDISSNIITTGTVDTSEEGTYTVKYNVTDSSGNEADEVVRTINVKNNEVPEGWIEIHTPEDLAKIGKNYSYPLNGKYILMNNIDLSGYEDWTPIGGEFFGFSGEFDGNGYKIENLTIDSHYGSQGLFGITHKKAVIKNLGLENVNISSSRRVSIGGLVGSNYGDIENCYVEGTVEGESSTGLLVGFNDGTIEKSYANGSVKGDSESTGGLVGYNFTGTIKETYSAGSVYGSKDNVGGLVGHNFAGDIIDSYSTARVEGRYNVGGLVGEMISGSITNCYAIGQVSDGRNNVGGLIGEAFDMVRIVDSYWDRIETNQASSSGGEGKLTKALLMQEFYSNWSFIDVWTIDENESYPYFKWQNKNIPEKSFDYFVEGNGTTLNPYIITNPEELNLVRYELDGHYKLGNDINLASYGQWEAIGTDKTEFKGSLDGDRHKIINLTIDADSDNQGLFGVIHKTAIIKNIGLENVNVSNTDNEYTGALAGENHGLIQNTYVKGSVKGEKFTGLLVGDNDGTIETSYTDGSIVGDSHYVGGLVGYNSGNINETYSTGSVYGAKNNVGGLVGTNRDGSIENSYSTASVEGKHDVGGLVGEVTSGTINNCYSTGEVTDIDNNDGHGHDGHWFGENKIGGLIGSKHFMATVIDSYWNIDTSGQRDSDGGIGKTTTEMKSEETYRNWNFQDVWSIDSRGKINNGYPCIQQIMPPTITLNGETETTLEVFSRYIEEGAVVTDIVEGNLTNNLKIIGSVDTSMLGDYKITYKVSDNMGNEVTEYRTIHVVDTTKPIITLIGDETVHLNVGDNYIEEGSTAEDNYDGNITDNIEISGAVDTNIEGTYEIKYNVTDDNGNIANEVIRTIVVTLGIPDNLMTSATSDSINISWLPVTGATGYDIEVYGSIVDAGDKTEYTHEGLNPNTQLTYRVRAKSSRSVSKWSGIVAQTTLTGTPKNIDAEATDTTIDLSWDPVSGAKAYDIEIDGVVSEIIDNKYLHDQLLSSSEHSYRIRSKNEEGISEWSELFIKSTLPSIPSNLSSDIQINEVTLTWDEVPRVTGYEVEINGEVIENGMSNTYTIDTNEPNKEYIFRVRSNNEGLNSGWSSQIVVITPPEEPKNLITTSLSTQITVKWDSVIGAEGYEIEIDGEVYDVGLKTTYMHSNLTPNTEYSYRIRSKNNGGISEWSEKIVATTLLSVPSNLGAVSSSDGIFLTWDDVDGAVGYDVLVDGETIDNGNSTVFEHKDLEPNTWHYYRVRAKQGEYVGDWSDSITQATLVGIPTNIHTSSSSSKIIVKWDTVNGAEGYDLLVDGELVEDVDSSKYRHDELDPGTTHSYKIRAKNSNGISDWSILVKQITSPDIPDDLEAEATTSEIRIVWDEVDGASSYDIEVDGKVIEELDTTEYIHKDLEPNTWHLYRVRARNNGGYSEWSEELQYNTKPEISVNVGKDTTFNFVVVAPKKDGVTTRYIEVNYNPDELEVIDLCAVTPEVNLESGDITGTNISVTSFEPGKITYKVTDADKTIVNSIKFKAKVSKHSKVTYEVK